MKIDVVDELHEVRKKYAGTPSGEIEKVAAEMIVAYVPAFIEEDSVGVFFGQKA